MPSYLPVIDQFEEGSDQRNENGEVDGTVYDDASSVLRESVAILDERDFVFHATEGRVADEEEEQEEPYSEETQANGGSLLAVVEQEGVTQPPGQLPPMPTCSPPSPPKPLFSSGSYLRFGDDDDELVEQFEDEPEDDTKVVKQEKRTTSRIEMAWEGAKQLHNRARSSVRGRFSVAFWIWSFLAFVVFCVLISLLIKLHHRVHPQVIDAHDYGGPNEHPREDGPSEYLDDTPPPTWTPIDRTWIRYGGEIKGMNEGHFFGASVVLSLDGDVLAVGIPGANNAQGQVQVFLLHENRWKSMGNRLEGEGQFGVSLDLSNDGTILAVGGNLATTESAYGAETGHVHVYQYLSAKWEPMGQPLEGDEPDESMGWSVALSGDGLKLAVGSPFYQDEDGRIQVFYFHENEWSKLGPQVLEHRHHGLGYGISMSKNGNYLAVLSNGSKLKTPHGVTVFERANETHWIEMGDSILDLGDKLDHNAQQGLSLSGDGTTVATAVRYDDGNDFISIHKFHKGKWEEWGESAVVSEGVIDHVGVSLNFDGSVLAVGASFLTGRGQVRIFEINNKKWEQVGEIIKGPDGFGAAVSLSGDGNMVAVGGGHHDSNKGMASVYLRKKDE